MRHPNQEVQRKKRQILKDKQKVRKKKSSTQGTWTNKEWLEQENREVMKRKKER